MLDTDFVLIEGAPVHPILETKLASQLLEQSDCKLPGKAFPTVATLPLGLVFVMETGGSASIW